MFFHLFSLPKEVKLPAHRAGSPERLKGQG
jgi:hypothetical protein